MRTQTTMSDNTHTQAEPQFGSSLLPLSSIVCGDNVVVMKAWPNACVDLVVTSPPYDNLRTYGGYQWDFEGVERELTRILKPGGVIVWVVADATVKGSETLTSARQAIYFKDVCGLNVHDTMIYQKSCYVPLTHNRYEQSWEYMFVFSKGRPKTWNAIRIPCKNPGMKKNRGAAKQYEAAYAERKREETTITNETKQAPNIFTYAVGQNEKTAHNAPFPDELARDHVISWSVEGDIVLDPFVGSGTTCLAAKQNGRRWVGIDINPEYVEICNRRLGHTAIDLSVREGAEQMP